jgi:hypothetical protein
MRILLIFYPIKQIMFIYLACKHIHCVHFHLMHLFTLARLHHTGSQTKDPVVVPEEPEEQLEVQPQEVPEADEEDAEELPECLDHRPSSFERGKPRSISLSVFK